jgi:hypothetical protein
MSDTHILGPQTNIRRAKEIVFQQFDDELLAVDAQANLCFSLNESAGRIWALIETPTSLAAICTQLCAEYDVDEATCLREVSTVLQNLSHAGLVRTGDDATPRRVAQ